MNIARTHRRRRANGVSPMTPEKRIRFEAKLKNYLTFQALVGHDQASMEEYDKQIEASEGFHVCFKVATSTNLSGYAYPVDKSDQHVGEAARFAVANYNNQRLEEGKDVELKRVVRAIHDASVFLLTLEGNDGQFYEAKVQWTFRSPDADAELILFRPAKYYPNIICCA